MEHFKATLKSPELLKTLVNSISPLIRDIKLSADDDGLSSRSMDAANVAMVDFAWARSGFESYECPQPTSWSVNLEDVKAALKRVKPESSVTIKVTDDKMELVTDDGSAKRQSRISLIADVQEAPKIPDLKFVVTASIPTHHWTSAIEDAADTQESVSITNGEDSIIIAAESAESTRTTRIEIRGQGVVVEAENEENNEGQPLPRKKTVTSRFSSDYLKRVLEPAKKATSVTFQWGKDYPCKTTYDLGALRISVIVAPRVDND
jgi:proliferating cell nuclear antigen